MSVEQDDNYAKRLEAMKEDGYVRFVEFIPMGPNLDRTARVSVMARKSDQKLSFIGRHRNYTRNLTWSQDDLDIANSLLHDAGVGERLVVTGGDMTLVSPKAHGLPVRTEPVPRGTEFHRLGDKKGRMKCLGTADGMVHYERVITRRQEDSEKALRGVKLEVPLGLFDVLFCLYE